MIIPGRYVTLRPLTPDDAEITQRWRTSGRAFLLNKGAQSVAEQRTWIRSREKYVEAGTEYNFVMVLSPRPSHFATGAIVPEELRRQPQPVGMISLVDIDMTHKRAEAAHFLIGEEGAVKGMPVAFEAVKLLYELAFDTLGLERLWGPVASGNRGMLTFHKYMGYRECGRLPSHYILNGLYHDAIFIQLDVDTYRAVTLPKLNRLIGAKS